MVAVAVISQDKVHDLAWRKLGACWGFFVKDRYDPFFPSRSNSNTAAAIRVCSACRVRKQCLDYAVEHTELLGVWGGATYADRLTIRRNRRRRKHSS